MNGFVCKRSKPSGIRYVLRRCDVISIKREVKFSTAATCCNTRFDLVYPRLFNGYGILHPFSFFSMGDVVTVAIRNICIGLEIHTIVSIGPSGIPSDVGSSTEVVIGSTCVVIGMVQGSQIEIRHMDHPRNRVCCKGKGFVRIHLTKHGIYHIFVVAVVGSESVFSELHKGIVGSCLGRPAPLAFPIIENASISAIDGY